MPRRKKPGISPAARRKLSAARVARLATISRTGPHLVPICFAYDGSFFYTAIDRKPKRVAAHRLGRLKNIKRNPQVALLIDEYREDWTRLWYVLVRGKAELVSGAGEREQALRRLQKKYRQYARGMLPEDALLLRITPQRITVWGKM
ncbi:MAG TPA: TIGR03668 family PPOX class F420-dependent oxidoreductase [Terriglobales bacterium]|nr:TIGR03668 family PPOX class F420-dependent oxidoreductase [Terriglobales bacterium]